MFRCAATVLVALLGVASALPVAAQWKWLDRNRVVQYSDLPPPSDVSDKDILQRPAAAQRQGAAVTAPAAASGVPSSATAASAPPLVPKAVEPELEAKRRQAEAADAARKRAEEDKLAAARAENCVRARNAVRTFDSGVRIARANEKGEREILDDATRAAEAKRARDAVTSDCQ